MSASTPARLDVSRETLERLEAYHGLLRKWNPRINLVSPRTLAAAWERHFLDSAQLLDLAPASTRHWVDLGSGGGFPGAVVAILAAERRPGLSVKLVESDQRKAVFLRTVAREVGVAMHIVNKRIEDTRFSDADLISARALAPLTELLGHVERLMTPAGTALFPKGRGYRKEITEALEAWTFDCEKHPSKTDAEAVVLEIGNVARAG